MASKQWEEAYERIKPQIEQVRAILSGIEFTGGIFDKAQALWIAIQEAVPMVEAVANEIGGLTGEEKLDLAARAADDIMKLPWYLEPFDGPGVKMALSKLVAYLNKKNGAEAEGVSFLGKVPVTA